MEYGRVKVYCFKDYFYLCFVGKDLGIKLYSVVKVVGKCGFQWISYFFIYYVGIEEEEEGF